MSTLAGGRFLRGQIFPENNNNYYYYFIHTEGSFQSHM